jgi:hypothetical protein
MAREAGDLGLFGAWLNPHYSDRQRIEFAAELEDLGFRTIWLGVGRQPVGDLRLYEAALCATREATIVPAIINVWQEPAEIVAEGYRRVRSEFGDRSLLGIGAGHPESNARYERPYAKLADYLARLDDSGVPAGDRILAALSGKTVSLAGARSAGAHPYLTTPAHTRAAREILGPGPLLAPEHKSRGVRRSCVCTPRACSGTRGSPTPPGWRRGGPIRERYMDIRPDGVSVRTEIAWPVLHMAGERLNPKDLLRTRRKRYEHQPRHDARARAGLLHRHERHGQLRHGRSLHQRRPRQRHPARVLGTRSDQAVGRP